MGSMGSDVRISETFEQAASESSNEPRHSLVTGLVANLLWRLLHGVEVDVQAELRGSVVRDLTAHLRFSRLAAVWRLACNLRCSSPASSSDFFHHAFKVRGESGAPRSRQNR